MYLRTKISQLFPCVFLSVSLVFPDDLGKSKFVGIVALTGNKFVDNSVNQL